MSSGQVRLFIFATIATIAMVCFGIGELWRCFRTMLGPSEVSFAQAGTQGLAAYGYVRVTGARAALDRAVAVQKQRKSRITGETSGARWDCAYVPVLDAADPNDHATCTLLAYLPRASGVEDIAVLGELDGENGDELVGFVEGPYESLDPWHQQNVAPKVGVNTRACWVVDVTKPSWFMGLGLVIAGLAITGVAVAWKLKKGFVD